ncbi:hypothetical protein FHS43_006582 [Streptosporangium becharense]|uniref:Uncharacterized protein n=1 Tax=Streptosporangium becharense TaxID=1816182 RepID=A0A7W9IC03_9ACTN|nr:hypothetical protein [Streptosporangium becharense]MBB2915262.1 hypothetical protein [Streptosporangium becharense]MBB5817909.1 hypothetical protein [Streptosporangium becharense]
MEESDDLTELRRLLFTAIPYPTEEENLAMLAQTLSSSTPDLSLLPGPDGFGPPPPQSAARPLVPCARRSADRAGGPDDADGTDHAAGGRA